MAKLKVEIVTSENDDCNTKLIFSGTAVEACAMVTEVIHEMYLCLKEKSERSADFFEHAIKKRMKEDEFLSEFVFCDNEGNESVEDDSVKDIEEKEDLKKLLVDVLSGKLLDIIGGDKK